MVSHSDIDIGQIVQRYGPKSSQIDLEDDRRDQSNREMLQDDSSVMDSRGYVKSKDIKLAVIDG